MIFSYSPLCVYLGITMHLGCRLPEKDNICFCSQHCFGLGQPQWAKNACLPPTLDFEGGMQAMLQRSGLPIILCSGACRLKGRCEPLDLERLVCCHLKGRCEPLDLERLVWFFGSVGIRTHLLKHCGISALLRGAQQAFASVSFWAVSN